MNRIKGEVTHEIRVEVLAAVKFARTLANHYKMSILQAFK